ncbi:MAG: bile acid:sodium symporter family protein [Pirellulales bacterium]|nr:bile acid:sodium symporter family protein [Pirellulales bacterium]
MKLVIERFLLLWLTLLGFVAYFWTDYFPSWSNPFSLSAGWLNYLFAVTMLAIGSLLPRDEILQVARRWHTVLGGTFIQYTAMPLAAYGVGRLMGLDGPLMIGVVMVGCVPGAMASNVLTLIAGGNVSYSVSLTTSATLLSPIVAPLLLKLALGQWVNFPALKVSIQLCWMVVIPVVVGYLLSRYSETWATAARHIGSTVANLTILWIIAVVVAKNRDKLGDFESGATTALVLVFTLLLINLLGYASGYIGGRLMRLPEGMRRALTLEVGLQNAGLGTVLAMELFGNDPRIALAPALYTFGCMFTGTILARAWAMSTAKRCEQSE